jgi:large subunit ribosomal protein L22
MEVQAKAKWVRTSPRKVRLVAQTLRNLPVSEALVACQFMPRAAARDVAKVIRSAQANAENNFNLVRDDLVIKDIRVEPGPMLKRGQPRAMGRLFSVFKRTSHITAVVEDRPGAVRRRTASLPRAPQPTAARPSGASGARLPSAPSAATTESDEPERPTSRRARGESKAEPKSEASTAPAAGKKGEARTGARKPEVKPETKKSEAKTESKRTESKKKDEKKDSKEKKKS